MKKAASPACPLCLYIDENVIHFIEHCEPLKNIRQKFKARLSSLFPARMNISITQATLDTNMFHSQFPETPSTILQSIEETTRDLLFQLHLERKRLLDKTVGKSNN